MALRPFISGVMLVISSQCFEKEDISLSLVEGILTLVLEQATH